MSLVLLFDQALAPLTHPTCRIVASDASGTTLVSTTSARLGPSEFGASIVPGPVVYSVCVHDASRSLAPATLTDLNGQQTSGQLDLVLYPVPVPSGGGHGPTTYGGIASYIDSRLWSPAQKQGVRSLVASYARFCGTVGDTEGDLEEMVEFWAEMLRELRIDPELFRPTELRIGEV